MVVLDVPHTWALEDLARISTKVAFLSVRAAMWVMLAVIRVRNFEQLTERGFARKRLVRKSTPMMLRSASLGQMGTRL